MDLVNKMFCCYKMDVKDIKDELNNCDYKDIELFNFKDYKTVVKVVDIYDGDTCTVIFKYENKIIKYKVRCYGYDSPEMRPSKSLENRELIKEKAREAKSIFGDYVKYNNGGDGIVYAHFHEFDKYGRLMATFYDNENFDGKSINDKMIENGYGYSYFGGTKKN